MSLSDRTKQLIELLFDEDDRETCLKQLTFSSCERTQFAAIKYSLGDFKRQIEEMQSSPPSNVLESGSPKLLAEAAALGRFDFRDLLVAVGFANDTAAHKRWFDQFGRGNRR